MTNDFYHEARRIGYRSEICLDKTNDFTTHTTVAKTIITKDDAPNA